MKKSILESKETACQLQIIKQVIRIYTILKTKLFYFCLIRNEKTKAKRIALLYNVL